MGRGLQGQRRFGVEPIEATATVVAAAATTTPAMQALIEASTAVSEARETESAMTTTDGADGGEDRNDRSFDRNNDRRQRTEYTPHDSDKQVPENIDPTSATTETRGIEFGRSSIDGMACLESLDPNDHARVSDPIVRPAKKHTPVSSAHNHNSQKGGSGGCENGTRSGDARHFGKERRTSETNKSKHKTTANIGFSDSILSRLFEPDRKQKPELWDFVRLVAPGPVNLPPEGQYKWRSKDAVAAYCLKCKIAFTYTPGTSKTVSRHLIAYHGYKSGSNRSSNPRTDAFSEARRPGEDRKSTLSRKRTDPSRYRMNAKMNTPLGMASAPPVHKTIGSQNTKAFKSTKRRNRTCDENGNNSSSEANSTTIEITDRNRVHRNDDAFDSASLKSPTEKSHAVLAQDQGSGKKRRLEIDAQRGRTAREAQLLPLKDQTNGRIEKLEAEMIDLLSDDHDDDDCEEAFLNGRGRNRKASIVKALFRWWIGSYQSLDCYDNPIVPSVRGTRNRNARNIFDESDIGSSLFVKFCKTLDDSFELPELSVMKSMAGASCERIRSEIKIHASKLFPEDAGSGTTQNDTGSDGGGSSSSGSNNKSHEFVSASVRRIRAVRIVSERTGEERNGAGDFNEMGDDRETRYNPSAGGTVIGNRCLIGEVGDMANGRIGGKQASEGCRSTPEGFEMEEKIFYPVRLTFCTPMFRIKSYVIAVIPEENKNEESQEACRNTNSAKSNDNSNFAPYFKAVDSALQMYGFPRDNVTRVVVRGSCQEVKAGVLRSTATNECLCILDRLDEVVFQALTCITILPRTVQDSFRRNASPEEGTAQDSLQSPSMFFTVRAFEILMASLSIDEETETQSKYTIARVLDIITPFRDAIRTLSQDSYSTIGLAISVVRRVRDVLLNHLTKLREDRRNPMADDADNNSSVDDSKNECLHSFHRFMLENLENAFASVLNENPFLMWTVPLDPRLIAMPSLSKAEKTFAKSILIEEVAKFVEIIDENNTGMDGGERTKGRNNSVSTMDGIFWGGNSDPSESAKTGSILTDNANRNAKEYATKNVDSYFNTVQSQRHVKDPLLWWSNNRDQFPELAMLARKWIGTSAVYGRTNSRDGESTSVISTSCSDPDSICRMIMLHDNNDLI